MKKVRRELQREVAWGRQVWFVGSVHKAEGSCGTAGCMAEAVHVLAGLSVSRAEAVSCWSAGAV